MNLDIFCVDIAVSDCKEGMLEQSFIDLGCNVFRMRKIRDGLIKYNRTLKNIIRQGNYDIVHVHSGYKSFFALYASWKVGVKCRIAHTHYAYVKENIFGKINRAILTYLTKKYSTSLFSCSSEASMWTWGKKTSSYIMINGIDLSKYFFSLEKRDELRTKYNLLNNVVYGCVGRLSYQKNHELNLRVFKEIHKLQPNAKFVLVGGGEEESKIKKLIVDLKLSNDVLLLGSRNDVEYLINMFDSFVLLSRFEGLGIVFVEAQTNGLFCYGSDKCVKDADLGRMAFVNISSEPTEIAQKIVDDYHEGKFSRQSVNSKAFDIHSCVSFLEDQYKKIYLEAIRHA